MSILISSDQFPVGERFEGWRETLRQSRMAPVEVLADNESDFRQSDPDLLSLGMLLHGRGAISQGDRQALVPAGGFTVYDVGRPYSIDIGTAGDAGATRALMLHFPRALLPLPPSHLERLTAVSMPAGQGIGALTARFLTELAAGIDHYGPTEAARLARGGARGAGHPAGP